jgi:hypothetical protein
MNNKEEIAMRILMSNDDEDTKLKKIQKMNFSTRELKEIITKLEKKVSNLESVKKLSESVLNENKEGLSFEEAKQKAITLKKKTDMEHYVTKKGDKYGVRSFFNAKEIPKKYDIWSTDKGDLKKEENIIESVLNELAAELGKKDGVSRVRYYIPPNPKPFTFDQLGPEQQKSAKKFAEQHKADFNRLGKGEFNTENGFDLVLKGNGVWKIKSQSLNIDKQVETK